MTGQAESAHHAQLYAILRTDPFRMRCLEAVAAQSLPDCFIAAGFVRNAIWDFLHNYPHPTPLNDIDVVYFDERDASRARDNHIEALLSEAVPAACWEVKNQARMHRQHNHCRYQNTTDAIAHWIEVPTCVGVRLESDGSLTVTAPYGLRHNFSLDVTINPLYPREAVFRQRMAQKGWQHSWPKLRFRTNR